VDEREPRRAAEEDQLLGAPRRVRDARKRAPAGQGIDQARFADIGAAGNGDLDAAHKRQRLERARGGRELPIAREQLAPGLDFRRGERTRYVHPCGFFLGNVVWGLSTSSVLAPSRL